MLTGIDPEHKQAEPALTVIHLDSPPIPHETLWRSLSPDEEASAARLRMAKLGDRYRTGRGMLRTILALLCQVLPSDLCFAYSSEGKPSLPDFPDVHFNVSHSGGLWACAVTRDYPLGLDIEEMRLLPDRDAIANRFFAPAEYRAISSLPKEARLQAFYRCWTRKEAYLKALGHGLGYGLDSFEVSCGEEQWSSVHDPAEPRPWRVCSFSPAPGFLGALVTPAL